MTRLLILFLLFSPPVSGQRHSPDSTNVEIINIKSYVNSINSNNSLAQSTIVKRLTEFSYDTVYFVKNGIILKISVIAPEVSFSPVHSSTQEYYFRDEKLVAVYETGFNDSRMGSCGLTEISTSLFFREATLIGMEVQKKPEMAGCYPVHIDEDEIVVKAQALLRLCKTPESQ